MSSSSVPAKEYVGDYTEMKIPNDTDVFLPERGTFFRTVDVLPHFSAG
jgi:hypothetical protein